MEKSRGEPLFVKADCDVKWVFDEYGEFPADFSENARRIVKAQYFRNGELSFWHVIERVVGGIMYAPRLLKLTYTERQRLAAFLLRGLAHQEFAFNSPVYYNVGVTDDPQCSACFIQSVDDDMESIMRLARNEAMVFKQGSGTGTNLSPLRASTERLSGSDGFASGPVSFMRGFDAFAGIIKSGGRTRRAAKMQLLDDNHPDLMGFVRAKADEDAKARKLISAGMSVDEAYATVAFQNLNTSARLSDAFMKEALGGTEELWVGVERDSGEETNSGLPASEYLDEIAQAAWECGDPGVQFSDTIERDNMTVIAINASNPCSEFMFMDESACNLASINVLKFLDQDGEFMYDEFSTTARTLIRVMDAIVDLSGYPTEEIKGNSIQYRPLGLGLSNVAAYLMVTGRCYGSQASADLLRTFGDTLLISALEESAELARIYGTYPGWGDDKLEILERKLGGAIPHAVTQYGIANAQLTLMAPTGTISFMMDCDSTGIEPVFAAEQVKKLADGTEMTIVPKCVLHNRVEGDGSAVVTAVGDTAVSWIDHLAMMAALQPYMSGGISKTVNLPSTASVQDIRDVFVWAWKLGLKSIAVYRDGSKGHQPLSVKRVRVEPRLANDDGWLLSVPTPEVKHTAMEIMAEATPSVLTKREACMKVLGDGEDLRAYFARTFPCTRQRLPDERKSITHKFSVNGMDGYVTVGMYEDGTPGEMFVKVAKEGSTASGFMDAWATVVSIYLQHGLPLSKIIEKGKGQRFEPSGFTGNSDLPTCTSLVDYILRWVELRFRDGRACKKDDAASVPVGDGASIARRDPVSTSSTAVCFGDTCPDCGNLVQTTGACKTCPSCGWNGGCG